MVKEIASGKSVKFSFRLKLSDDRLKLFLDAEPIKVSDCFLDISPEELTDTFPGVLVQDFFHKEVINDVCKELSSGKKVEERRIAKGRAAEDGKDGRIVFMVRRMSKKAELESDSRGYVDFKDLHLFENVRTGSLVAKVFGPEAGKAGMDPVGKLIAPKTTKAAKISFDNSIKAEAHKEGSGQDLIAVKDGYLLEESGRISIQEELNISDSVDYKTGSLDFIGSIRIKGDVLPGFIVRGKKGVFVSGSVTEATVCSSEGNVEIKGFLHGGISSKIEASKEVILNVAQQAEVFAGTGIRVMKEARHCNFHSSGIIAAEKALIISGEYSCACGIEAKEIGSKASAQLAIYMSSSIAATQEYILLESKIAQHEKAIKLLAAHLGPLALTSAGQGLLSEKHQQKLLPLISKKQAIDSSLAELNSQKQQLIDSANLNNKFRVNAISRIYPGVRINVHDNNYLVQTQIQGPKTIEFDFEKKEFIEKDYQALECQLIEGVKNERK